LAAPSGFHGFVPYLRCEDADAVAKWYVRVFGFKEKQRWTDSDGVVRNVELTAGTELWLDGSGPGWWESQGHEQEQWIGVWSMIPTRCTSR